MSSASTSMELRSTRPTGLGPLTRQRPAPSKAGRLPATQGSKPEVSPLVSSPTAATSDAFRAPEALSHLPFQVAADPFVDMVPAGRFSPRFKTAAEAKSAFSRGVEPLWNGTRRDARAILKELQPALEEIAAQSRSPE